MVKKLLVQEYKYYIRTLMFILPALILYGITTRIIQFFQTDSPLYSILFFGSLLIFIFGSIGVIIAAEVLGIVRFYKNMYSTEGYLTFTLPVSNHQHLISKLIAHVSCIVVTFIVVIIAWLVAFVGTDFLKMVFDGIGVVISELINIDFGVNIIHIIIYVIEFLIILLVSLFTNPLLYYACISIGQTAKKNRILLAIAAFYIYTVIIQVITTFGTMIFTLLGMVGAFKGVGQFIGAHPFAAIHIFIFAIMLVAIGLTCLYYFINIKIMNNKLNLE